MENMRSHKTVTENFSTQLHDLKKKIIPIKVEKEYKPRGPLGLIVSGVLFVDFSDPSQFDEKLEELTAEIESVLGLASPDENRNIFVPGKGNLRLILSDVH